ncbi:MAG: hypothetical protein HOM14_07150 [Gammaproteobacteria bacterium]|jgi:hypothetical protein|nr:hypothetical protein [Gammaproteobacteria bacterium]MBT3722788.1 hypothetical protein [Gammaproteobacteria bacterium]MBT4077351.1 hypothetical protein [Gammaproteobacteria bacterium]MBT4193445.1 hypothetical protein [Gammaproteobacteria bacterium]MBT4450362.1 hypothetical protein [Gammaproteobacteria bacterium]
MRILKCLFLVLSVLLTACNNSDKVETVSSESGNLILTESHGGEGSAWGLAECDGCHVLNSIHQQADSIRSIVQSKGYDSCTGCHGSNGSSEPRKCLVCHNSTDLAEMPIAEGKHSHTFDSESTEALKDEQCVECHLASDMNGDFDPNRDLTRLKDSRQLYTSYTSSSDFCLRCHNRDHQQTGFEMDVDYENPLIAMADNYKYVDKHGEKAGTGERSYAGLREGYRYDSFVECTDCHVMHGTDNTGLIIDDSKKGLSKLDPEIRIKPYSIDNASGNNAELCVMCHQMDVLLDEAELDVGNGLSGLHEIAGNCQLCHSHGEAVQAGM